MQFGQLDRIGQAQPRAAMGAGAGIFHLLERPQHAFDVGGGNADAMVAHRDVTERSGLA